MHPFLDSLKGRISDSEPLRLRKEFEAGISRIRNLKPGEIRGLKRNDNHCDDWSKVRTTSEKLSLQKIRGNFFQGDIILPDLDKRTAFLEAGNPAGIYRSVIQNVRFSGPVSVSNVRMLSRCDVEQDVVLQNIGEISCIDEQFFAYDLVIKAGNEYAGKDLPVFGDLLFHEAVTALSLMRNQGVYKEYLRIVRDTAAGLMSGRGFIGKGSVVVNTVSIRNSFIGRNCRIMDSSGIYGSTLLGSAAETTFVGFGTLIRFSLLQWGSRVTDQALVLSSMLCEHSSVEKQAKIYHSLIGPNTSIAEGEVTASFCGPFIGLHHQSLLIAAYWPEGKGNVAAGAQVGSNHSGRMPDQEIRPGEGTFFGLGTNITFPSNFSGSPYILIAAGVRTLPQKLEMPFALIKNPSMNLQNVSPALNELLPGWVLSDNLFALFRNMWKYRDRNRASRTRFEFEVFRPDIMQLVESARDSLASLSGKEYYTARDLQGLGKNYLLEKDRVCAVNIYSFFLRYYALHRLFLRVASLGKERKSQALALKGDSQDAQWEWDRKLLLAECGELVLKEYFGQYKKTIGEIFESAQRARDKDHKRALKINGEEGPMGKEPLLSGFEAETRETISSLEKLIEG